MKITIYTIPDCQFCKQEKDYLTSKGLPFNEKDVMANKDFLAEMLQKSQNFAGVPFTTMEEGTTSVVLKGFTLSEFEEAIAKISGESAPVSAPAMTSAQPTSANVPVPSVDTVASPSAAPIDMPKPAEQGMNTPSITTPASTQPFSTPTARASVQPTMPSLTPTDTALDDPQEELNSLLEDLQTKVDVPSSGPVSPSPVQSTVPSTSMPSISVNPTTPAIPMSPSTPAMPAAPSMSSMPPLGQSAQPMNTAPSTSPTVPDFTAQQ